MASPENIDIDKDILENIYIDIDKGILQNININKDLAYRTPPAAPPLLSLFEYKTD